MQVNIKIVHSFLRWMYLIYSVFCIRAWYYVTTSLVVYDVSFSLFPFVLVDFILNLDISSGSLLFISVVSLITSVVLIFSYAYITEQVHSLKFLIKLNLFVFSIIFVISFKSLFVVILGWDGLGVISFFLILYYHSPYSVFSAWFTILINRLGDRFLILCIVLFIFTDLRSIVFNSSSYYGFSLLSVLLVLGLITKSALFPFSPWLPIAMRAPTPISSLVHSSTLVTAGLYLIMRFDVLLLTADGLSEVLMWISLFTSFYAGVGALFESDLKKLVALSTLSHLGFIGISLFRGIVVLAYFHLLAHALFKSLLFMGVGDWISVGHHYQDSRALSGGVSLSPFSSLVILSSIFSLLGIPFLVGFYSKDMVLESLFYSNIRALYLVFVYTNVFLTFNYTLRVVKYVVVGVTQPSPLFISSHYWILHYFMLSLLRILSFVFPVLFFYITGLVTMLAVPIFHWMPFIILFLAIRYLSTQFIGLRSFRSLDNLFYYIVFTCSNMFGIRVIYSSAVTSLYVSSFSSLVKLFELGALNHLSQYFIYTGVESTAVMFYKYCSYFLPVAVIVVFVVFILLWVYAVGNNSFESCDEGSIP